VQLVHKVFRALRVYRVLLGSAELPEYRVLLDHKAALELPAYKAFLASLEPREYRELPDLLVCRVFKA